MIYRMRMRLFLCEAISLFRINSLFSLNPLLLTSSSNLHTSNQPLIRRSDLNYAFDCINNIDEAVALFHYMLQMKHKPSSFHYNTLFKTVARFNKVKHYSQVVLMFKELTLLGCPVNEYIMSNVMNCYAHLKEVELCFPIVATFLKRGYKPDIVSLTCLIKGFFLIGNVAKAVDLYKKLVRSRLYRVDAYTIATVLDGVCKSGNVVDAVQLLKIAERNNWKLNVAGYTAVIDGLCKARMLKDGMELLSRMIDRGILPNVVTYTCFIHALCNHKRIAFARTIFNELPLKGIYPTVITFTVMIQGLCRAGLFQDAKEMLEKMERVRCFPTDVTYNVILQVCLLHRDNFYSIEFLKQIVGRDFQLDAPSFFVVLREVQVLRQMKGVYDDVVINQLILKLVSSDAINEMRDRYDEFSISSLIHKLESSDSTCSVS